MKLLFVLAAFVCVLVNPSEAQLPDCLPALTTYLKGLEAQLQSVKTDLANAKKDIVTGSYCILAKGPCPAGFTRYSGHMLAIKMYSHTPTYIKPATFGDSKIKCHGPCGRYGQWVGELHITACCK